MPPLVTVLIPTHSRLPLLRRTLGSALDQRGVDHEVLVVDDGSRDGTPAALAGIDDARLRVLRHDDARGVARARNHGIAEAAGAWIAFLDDDDLWAPGKLATLLAAGDRAGAGVAYSSALVLDDAGRLLDVEHAPPGDRVAEEIRSFNAIPGGCSNIVARTDLVRAAGGFDERFSLLADWDMWLSLLARGGAVSVDEPLLAYLKHATNMHAKESLRSGYAELRALRAKHPDPGLRPDIRKLSRWAAGGFRRGGRPGAAARAYLGGAILAPSIGNVVRAAGLLLGERAMGLGHAGPPEGATVPGWVEEIAPAGEAAQAPH